MPYTHHLFSFLSLFSSNRPTTRSLSRQAHANERLARLLNLQNRTIKARLTRRHTQTHIRVSRKADHEHGARGTLEVPSDETGLAGARLGVFGGRVLVVLEDVGDALEAVVGGVVLARARRDGRDLQQGGALVEDDVLGAGRVCDLAHEVLDLGDVRDQRVDDFRPRVVQRLVPDAGRQDAGPFCVFGRDFLDGELDGRELGGFVGLVDQVHFVHEDEDFGVGREGVEGVGDGFVGVLVRLHVAAFDVEDVDQH